MGDSDDDENDLDLPVEALEVVIARLTRRCAKAADVSFSRGEEILKDKKLSPERTRDGYRLIKQGADITRTLIDIQRTQQGANGGQPVESAAETDARVKLLLRAEISTMTDEELAALRKPAAEAGVHAMD